MWIADWIHAKAAEDTAMLSRASAALGTAASWPVFAQMSRSGAWPQVLVDVVKPYTSPNTVVHRVAGVQGNGLDQALGCGPSWGVKVG
jgi:hypothetical protein